VNKVTISAVGDVMVGGLLSSNISKYKGTFLEEDVRKSLSADICFCNLECPLCNLKRGPKKFKTVLHAKEESITYLKNAGFNIVSLANNHTTDFGWGSLEKTMKILEENDINHVGAGKNIEEARKPHIFDINGLKIAFLAYYTEIFNISSTLEEGVVYATEKSYGVSLYNPDSIRNNIEALRRDVDYIIASFHWGDEFIHYPTPRTISESRRIIDMGADVIIGHGPHVLQGYEEYHGGLIFYSLSNFLFSPWFATNDGRWINYEGEGILRRWYPECRESIIVKLTLSQRNGGKRKIGCKVIPTLQENVDPIVRLDTRKRRIRDMEKWSSELQNMIYAQDYIKLIRKDYDFRFLKQVRNEIATYGVVSTLSKGKNKILKLIR